MNNETNRCVRILPLYFIVIAQWLISCEGKPGMKEGDRVLKYVYDEADFLDQVEEDLLSKYFDSIKTNTGRLVIYSGVNNFQRRNFDSLASKEFGQFPIEENGALVVLSRTDATAKILVGKQIHSVVTDTELSQLTEEMIPYFKLGQFYQGVRNSAKQLISLSLRKDQPLK